MWAGFFQNEGYGMGKEELGETKEVEGQQVRHEIGPQHLLWLVFALLSFIDPPLNPLKCIAMRTAGWKRRKRWQRRRDHLLEDDNMLTLRWRHDNRHIKGVDNMYSASPTHTIEDVPHIDYTYHLTTRTGH